MVRFFACPLLNFLSLANFDAKVSISDTWRAENEQNPPN